MKFEIFTPTVIHELGKRSNQEDSVFPAQGQVAETDRLFLVCDGMGGHSKGEVASANVIDAMTSWIEQRTLPDGRVTDEIIKQALQQAHNRLDALDDGAESKMGTTLTLVCLHSGGVSMAHVGDSRIYHIRPSEHKLLYKSIDHSLVYDLYRNGVISYEEMATSPQRNVITRAIMPGEENKDKIDIAHTTNVQPGDYFYLCSDGMLEQMTDEQLLNVLCADTSDVMKVSSLVSMTNENKDNHTALLIKIKDVALEPGDENLINDEHLSPYNEVAQTARAAGRTEPIAPAPQANAAPPAARTIAASSPAPKAGGDKKGVNKLLLLLVILLLAIVVAMGIYFFLLKGNDGDKSNSGEESSASVPERVEQRSSVNKTTPPAKGDGEKGVIYVDDSDDSDDAVRVNNKNKQVPPPASGESQGKPGSRPGSSPGSSPENKVENNSETVRDALNNNNNTIIDPNENSRGRGSRRNPYSGD